MQRYYPNKPEFNAIYSRYNLPNKIKYDAYLINLDEYFDNGTHWIALHVLNNNVSYFDSFGVIHILKQIEKFIERSTIVTDIFRLQVYNSIMCRYFSTGFIDLMLKGKGLTDFTNLF